MYYTGIIKNTWPEEFNFPWVRQPLKKEETETWDNKGYKVKNYSGLMYDNKNPMPDWIKEIGNSFHYLQNKTYTLYKMETCDIMPTHIDHFETYCRLFDVSKIQIRRAIVFLKDWSPGHYFEISGKGFSSWSKGEYVLWDCDEPHAAANIGIEPRYTLQITGHV